ncbi:amino ABC transporter, permease protein, 3-TM region, His/Glu/Gln/Arg/opine family [Ewingella americana]|uniref:Amino ABC transporter, permease protein, 3-TM region, His/Glu/Gln/Arg/opine family n=1 Tax=Ewingella americana TaxID=41202 RepID=A0A377THF7_9GAMM|nr:amino ABC transporter, permease protein, 3-TM region, His/Glu/Gln/Arg/opine family [Ewingella americana]
MSDFSLWDIYRNLLLALRWTVGLSLIAFIGGGIVGAILLVMRLSHRRWLQTIRGDLRQPVSGHAAVDAAVFDLLRTGAVLALIPPRWWQPASV